MAWKSNNQSVKTNQTKVLQLKKGATFGFNMKGRADNG